MTGYGSHTLRELRELRGELRDLGATKIETKTSIWGSIFKIGLIAVVAIALFIGASKLWGKKIKAWIDPGMLAKERDEIEDLLKLVKNKWKILHYLTTKMGYGYIDGAVIHGAAPIDDAVVRWNGLKSEENTDKDGKYLIMVPPHKLDGVANQVVAQKPDTVQIVGSPTPNVTLTNDDNHKKQNITW